MSPSFYPVQSHSCFQSGLLLLRLRVWLLSSGRSRPKYLKGAPPYKYIFRVRVGMVMDGCRLVPTYLTGLRFVWSSHQAPQSPERLRCYYKTGHPLCTIKRCPIEVVFTNPDIMILRNIMSDAEIDKVIKISKPLVRTLFYLTFNFL